MSYTPRGAHAEDLCRLASLSGNSSGNIPARVRHRECITMYASRNLITRYIIGIGRRRIFSAPRVAAMPHWTRSNRMPNRRMPHRGGIRERDRSASVGSLLSLPTPPLPPLALDAAASPTRVSREPNDLDISTILSRDRAPREENSLPQARRRDR